jgi:hypothetical protein
MGPCRDGPQGMRAHDIPLGNRAHNPKFSPLQAQFQLIFTTAP